MDAQTLYQDGISAIRVRGDYDEGRRLLTQVVKLDPQHDMAWLWLSRTLDTPDQQMRAIDRAIKINPNNNKAHRIRQKLLAQQNGHAVAVPIPSNNTPRPAQDSPEVIPLLRRGNALLERGNTEGAIEQWVQALEIQPDHEETLRNAVKALVQLNYQDDAYELVWRAVQSGTHNLSIYLTAMDLANLTKNYENMEAIRARILNLPTVTEDAVIKIAEAYLKINLQREAHTALQKGLRKFPESQQLLLMMGDLYESLNRSKQAVEFYNRAVAIKTHSKVGKEADKRLQNFAPVMTDKERGSALLAWRETAGISILFFSLAFMDSYLDILRIDAPHWAGILLSIVGGYVFITATSSPQQGILVKLFGGEVNSTSDSKLPILPDTTRYILGGLALVVLLVAFGLTFSQSLELLFNPIQPSYPFDILN